MLLFGYANFGHFSWLVIIAISERNIPVLFDSAYYRASDVRKLCCLLITSRHRVETHTANILVNDNVLLM